MQHIPNNPHLLICGEKFGYQQLTAVADPFIYVVNNRIYVLVEVEGLRGDNTYFKKIGVFEVSKNITNSNYLGELSLGEGEFSFPYVFRDKEKIYMTPETSKEPPTSNKQMTLYSTTNSMFPFGWKKEKDIVCKGLHSPSDKFIVKHGNSWFLFVSDAEGGGQLKLYFSTDMKTWTKHPQSPILKRKTLHRILNKYLPYCVYKTKPWRLGGGPAKLHDSLVVPLQHWFHKKIYGEAVSLLVITKLTQDKIASSLSTNPFLFPDSGEKWRSVGSHHFSLAIDEDGRKVVATDGFDGKVWSSAIEKVGSGFQLGSVL